MISTPVHKTNNLILRFMANYISSPISHMFLTRSLRIYFMDEDQIVALNPWRKFRMNLYAKLYPKTGWAYARWGTTYQIDMDAWRESLTDSDSQES